MRISQRGKTAALLVTSIVAASLAMAQVDEVLVHSTIAAAWFAQFVDLLVTVLSADEKQ